MHRDLLPKVHGLKNQRSKPSSKKFPSLSSESITPSSINTGTDLERNAVVFLKKMRTRCRCWQLVALVLIVFFIYFMLRENRFDKFASDSNELPRVNVFQASENEVESTLGHNKIGFLGELFKGKQPLSDAPANNEASFGKEGNLGAGETLASVACVPLKSAKSLTKICIYHPEEDNTVSASLLYNGTWDEDIVEEFKLALSLNPALGLIDIGANLGTYSLIAASMDRPVVAVEASHYTALRLKRSVEINNFFSRISIIEAAIMPERGYVRMYTPIGNAAGAYPLFIQRNSITEEDKRNHVISKAIKLDDIVQYAKFHSAILKIDIDGEEYSLLHEAERLFNVRNIAYVFMMFSPDKGELLGKSRGVKFLQDRGYIPKRSIKDTKMFLGAENEKTPSHLVWVKNNG